MMRPFSLVSLWDMLKRFQAANAVPLIASMTQLASVASTDRQNRPADGPMMERAREVLRSAIYFSHQMGFALSGDLAAHVLRDFEQPTRTAEIQHKFDDLIRLFSMELEREHFFVLEQASAAFYEQPTPFGVAVDAAFPGARADIAEAHNCFALGRYTASVHHSMSVLEPGLHALAVDVGAAVGNGMWRGIVDRIEKRVREIEKELPGSATKSARMEFLSQAAKEFVYFKDGWRNHVAHGRRQYDKEEALGAMNHVKAFMQALAKQLHE